MLLLELVHGGLDGGGVRHGRMGADIAAGPQRDAATGLEHAGGTWPEARHVEPVRGVGGGDEIDAGILDRRREVLSKFFSRGDLEADGFGSGRDAAQGASGSDHAFGRVEANGVSEVQSEPVGGGAGTAADIEEGVELAAGGCVVVGDGLIHARVVGAADLGVSFALFLVVGAERFFRRERSRSGSRLGHGEQIRVFSRSPGSRARRVKWSPDWDVFWASVRSKTNTKSSNCSFLSLQYDDTEIALGEGRERFGGNAEIFICEEVELTNSSVL